MIERLANAAGFRGTPAISFVSVFITMFFLVLVTTTAITFILPEVYSSTARVRVISGITGANGQPSVFDSGSVRTAFELIQSDAILMPVIDKLNLNAEWGKKYYNGEQLRTAETMTILKPRLQFAPIRNTMLIAITAYSDDPVEAAHIANAIAESYRDYQLSGAHRTSLADAGAKKLESTLVADPTPVIVDVAEPGHAPVKPNKPLNIALGALFALILALVSGAGAAFLTNLGAKRKRRAA